VTAPERVRNAEWERELRCRHCVSEVLIYRVVIGGVGILDITVVHANACPWEAREKQRERERVEQGLGWLVAPEGGA
jgi:hypothetical protein